MKLDISNRGKNLLGQEMFKILDQAKKLESLGKKIIHLELGQARFTPPVGVKASLISSLDKKKVGYSSSYGLEILRKNLANKLNKKYGFDLKLENVLISTANLLITECIHLLADKNDKVAFFSPTFPTYIAATKFLENSIVDIPLKFENSFQLTFNDIDEAIIKKPKVIIINSANNPTGQVYSKEVIDYLVEKTRLHNIWLISDETYGELCFNDEFTSLSNYSLDHIIVISSFSKIYSIPGFRLGYAISNSSIIEKLSLSNSTLVSCFPIFTQEALVDAVIKDSNYLGRINQYLLQLTNQLKDSVQSSRPFYDSIVFPKSGFYLFINIKKTKLTSFDFSNKLLSEYFVATTPGKCFGESFDDFIRISYTGEKNEVLKGMTILKNFYLSLIG